MLKLINSNLVRNSCKSAYTHFLSSPFQKFAHVFSGRQLQVLGFSIARTHARDQGVQVSAGEFPLEGMGNALVVALEVFELLGNCLQASEVVRCERLALQDREVDLESRDSLLNFHSLLLASKTN